MGAENFEHCVHGTDARSAFDAVLRKPNGITVTLGTPG
jgi:hypothetical protein